MPGAATGGVPDGLRLPQVKIGDGFVWFGRARGRELLAFGPSAGMQPPVLKERRAGTGGPSRRGPGGDAINK
ncbi:MAG: hypothetical protein WAV07_04485 [Candidatus Contendobacter sp.]